MDPRRPGHDARQGPYGPGGPVSPGGPAGSATKPITGGPETLAMHALAMDPRTGLPRGEQPPASTAAVIALVCGILLCLGPITGISAIIAGVVGRREARARPREVGGSGIALAGILLGALNLTLSFAAGVWLVATWK